MPNPQSLDAYPHETLLSALARADADRLKAFAEGLVAELDAIDVLENRTGLVMLPMQDTAQGTNFHLGEVLVSKACIAALWQVKWCSVNQ
ncbi:phosphonate C-P lyase system protein PhnG [Cognatiyoonia sp. IB215446]|uniref:phosphonate C-P lyase system protein PhnG n=1 Tax=Cognatiyoonia sp. IB215446 TaxID=3097355 RepID=UPI002A0C53F6|nr:phosphonate C-P lyase system protein PhnG [Cognatiyoonia sp. IB215446]MDX8349434.1 phosphonate C-P lyase system protein PhnG [Cognatiyoonia sp. IB215446]